MKPGIMSIVGGIDIVGRLQKERLELCRVRPTGLTAMKCRQVITNADNAANISYLKWLANPYVQFMPGLTTYTINGVHVPERVWFIEMGIWIACGQK